MTEHAGVTCWQVQQIWQAADLKPHRLKTFKISNGPDFAEKVFDVVGLYLNPPDNQGKCVKNRAVTGFVEHH